MTFVDLIVQNGFARRTPFKKRLDSIDKPALCDYLKCSPRTLDRWLKENNACPRAMALLSARQQLHDDFSEFSFTRFGIYHPHWRRTLTATELRDLPQLNARLHAQLQQLQKIKRYLDMTSNAANDKQILDDLQAISDSLNELTNTARFRLVKSLIR